MTISTMPFTKDANTLRGTRLLTGAELRVVFGDTKALKGKA